MTLQDEEVIKIHAKSLMRGASARCAMCGTSLELGRIMSPGFEYGMVLCARHGEIWMDAVVRSFSDNMVSWEDILRDAGLQ